jgi:hypothetical protein
MARKAKPPPPAMPDRVPLWREQQRVIRDLTNPRLRAQLDEARKTAEAVRNLLSPEAREVERLMREQREVLRRLGIGDEPPRSPSPLQPPSPPPEKTRRGRPIKLTNDEIAAGVTIVRRENAEYQKRFGRQLKQREAFRALKKLKVTRDGKPLTISPATWRRWVAKRALDPEYPE